MKKAVKKEKVFTKPSRKNISKDIYIRVGENIRVLREEAEMSVKELAYTAGISPSFLANIENAKRKPTLYTIERLARALSAATNDVIGMEVREDVVCGNNRVDIGQRNDMESLVELIEKIRATK